MMKGQDWGIYKFKTVNLWLRSRLGLVLLFVSNSYKILILMLRELFVGKIDATILFLPRTEL